LNRSKIVSNTVDNFVFQQTFFEFIKGEIARRIGRKQFNADVAQLVEQLICNQLVGGSIPSIGSESGEVRKD
jgi:hypothetical protein